jgi:hypothetical protein
VYHNNQSFSMDQFRGLIEHLLSTAELQCRELMFDALPGSTSDSSKMT